jgi:pyridoxamine 5'-phosphate oxidase
MNFNAPPTSPVNSAQDWFDEANRDRPTPNPLAMALSTVDEEGVPSSRMVLQKGFDERGVVFFTNYTSEKADAILANPKVCVLFHWDEKQRQIRIQGTATKISDEESDAYFATRNRLSQVGAWASKQSQPLKSRTVLMAKVAALSAKWLGRSVARPDFWGGYRITLDTVELWQGHDGRLHDRIRYAITDGVWNWERLQP